MDHPAPATNASSFCAQMAEKRRRVEPYLFFSAVVLAVLLAIGLLVREAYSQVGPRTTPAAGASAAAH